MCGYISEGKRRAVISKLMKIAGTRHGEGPGRGHAINHDDVLRFWPVRAGDEVTTARGEFFPGEE